MAKGLFSNSVDPVPSPRPRIAYLFTTFPKSTETFLQREVLAMKEQGLELQLYSLIGGGGEFAGIKVNRFSMWRLVELIWIIPWVAVSRWEVFGILWNGLITRRPPGMLNFWENMLGAGFAGVFYPRFRRHPPNLIHAAWSGAPATAAWILARLGGYRYSTAAHAYDIYEHGGDWWLDEKLAEARFIHTSTEMGKSTLVERGVEPDMIHVIRRGIDAFPICRALRPDRSCLHLICIARLVEKKGLLKQLEIYRCLREAGVRFEARIVGEGPMREPLLRFIEEHALSENVSLWGHVSQSEVRRQLAWADGLLHTGVIAASGDRDGLPNVIPEAMMSGVLVVTSPAAATTEAITEGETGWVCDVDKPNDWVRRLKALQSNEAGLEVVRQNARRWTEENYDGHRNAARLADLFRQAAAI